MRMRHILAASAAIAAFSLAAPAMAVTTFTTNFDSVDFGTGPGYTIIPTYEGWTSTTNGIEIQYNNVAGQAFSGANLVELDTTTNSSMSRLIDAGSYLLTYYYSDRPNVGAASNGLVAQVNGVTVSTSVGGNGGAQTNWIQQTARFTLVAPGTLTFAATGDADGLGGYLDSVSLSTVPEPATWLTMILGFGLLGGALRRRAQGGLATA